MFYSCDRTEGNKAVLIDDKGGSLVVQVSDFEESPTEGGIYALQNGRFVFQGEETRLRRKRLFELTQKTAQTSSYDRWLSKVKNLFPTKG